MNFTDKLIPLGDRYLIKPHIAANKSASGLSMENSSNVSSAPVLGTILKVGSKAELSIGDQVLFLRYSISELKFITEDGEQTIFIVEGSDIVAVVKKNEEISISNLEVAEVSMINDGEVVKIE